MENHPEIVELMEDVSESPLYSEDLAPVAPEARSWNRWNLAAIWVGMAVCIPTYMLAADMIRKGIDWWAALLIIGIANVIITLPMVLNGHAGVRYGVPFPVLGRASFGTKGVHIVSILRAVVAAGWFGVQTWIGGQAFYAIWNAISGSEGVGPDEIDLGKFIGFGLFWLVNVYFIWKGTESIKWLETWSAPILVLMGLALIGWGASGGGGISNVLEQDQELQKINALVWALPDEQAMVLETESILNKASVVEWRVTSSRDTFTGMERRMNLLTLPFDPGSGTGKEILAGKQKVEVKFYRTSKDPDKEILSSS